MAHIESYRLRDGSKRYRARWVRVDGRARSRSFVLKKDAERFVLEQRRRASLGALYQAPPQTLGEFLAGWLDRYALRVRPSTLARVRQVLPHLDVFARVALDEIRPAAVEDHVAALARHAPRQAELALRVLKQVLANAKERGHLVDEGVFRVKAPRRDDLSGTAAHVLRRQLLARKPNDLGLVFPSPRGALLNDDNFRHRVFAPA